MAPLGEKRFKLCDMSLILLAVDITSPLRLVLPRFTAVRNDAIVEMLGMLQEMPVVLASGHGLLV